MSQVMVSVIVTVYKIPEKFLRQCIDSLLRQTLDEIEILLIDDGSPDSCGKICDEYAKKDCRIRTFHQENKGVSVARNVGMQEAFGKYITFVDGDDWCDERMCEMACAFAEKNNSDVVFCSVRKASKPDNLIYLWNEERKRLSEKEKKELIDAAVLPRLWTDGAKIAAWGKIYRTSAVRGSFEYTPNIRYGQDNVFNLSIFQSALNFSYCPDACYYYQDQNPMQTMSRFNPQKYEDVTVLVDNLKGKLENNSLNEFEIKFRTRKMAMIMMNVLPQQFFHPANKDLFFVKYSKLKRFVDSEELQKDLCGNFVGGFFSLSQQIAIWTMRRRLWFLLFFVDLKWTLQRKIGLWHKD